jgi:hypothetical protein
MFREPYALAAAATEVSAAIELQCCRVREALSV